MNYYSNIDKLPKHPSREAEKPSSENTKPAPRAEAAIYVGNPSKAAAEQLRMEKARRLARQIAMDSQLARGTGSSRLPEAGSNRSADPGAQKLAARVARILYTPITLDLVRNRTEKPAKGTADTIADPRARAGAKRRQAAPDKKPAPLKSIGNKEAAGEGDKQARGPLAAERPGRTAGTGERKPAIDGLADMMNADDLAALMSDRDMASLLETDDPAWGIEPDEVMQNSDIARSTDSKIIARGARTGATREESAPIEYRIPMDRTIARIALYGICLSAIAGTYIYYREVVSQQKTPISSEQRGLVSLERGQPEDEKPADGEESALPRRKTITDDTEDEEMRGVEGAGRIHNVLKNTIFGR